MYSLVRVKPTNVGNGSVVVDPPRPWNRQRRFFFFDSVRWVEDWTLNGPYLDGITFVSGLPSGEYLVRQRKTDERQVPKFRANMTAPEITAMLESAYPRPRRRGRVPHAELWRRGSSSDIRASSSTSSISTATNCGAREGRSARSSTAVST